MLIVTVVMKEVVTTDLDVLLEKRVTVCVDDIKLHPANQTKNSTADEGTLSHNQIKSHQGSVRLVLNRRSKRSKEQARIEVSIAL